MCVLMSTQTASRCSRFVLFFFPQNCISGVNSVADKSVLLNVNIVDESMAVMIFI